MIQKWIIALSFLDKIGLIEMYLLIENDSHVLKT